MTTLGNSTVLSIAVAAVVGFLLVKARPATAAMIVATTLSGSLLVWKAKLHVARARPDVVLHLVEVTSRSLPSGQATDSAIVYLTLAVLASQ